ncbi:protein LYRIC-like [Menidia menidia]
MEQWQDAASKQVKLLTNRLNELLSKGLVWLNSEFGVDLGLKPELIPPWMILLAACIGLVLLVALWASVCRSVFRRRPNLTAVDDGIEAKRGVSKGVKAEEPKKKKKKTEKKAQPNGRVVAESQEEAIEEEGIVPHHQAPPPEVKIEKVAETKKSKKKAKQAVKETKPTTADGKEPEEGTWETKVSNKEKREQRKKDKSSSDGSASPGGGDTPIGTPLEQPKDAPSVPSTAATQKKKKGNVAKMKAEKGESVVPQANSAAGVEVVPAATDVPVKAPAHSAAPKTTSWTTSRQPAPLWRPTIDESWPVPTADLNLVGLGVGPAQTPPVNDLSWLSQPRVDDEWSGLNGSSADHSSDWNAPSEPWGNYEEPTPEPPQAQEQTAPEPAKINLIGAAEDDEDEDKDKGDATTDGGAKAKKKKKKKKKTAEDGAAGQPEEPAKELPPTGSVKKQSPAQESLAAVQPVRAAAVEIKGERPVKEAVSQKLPVTQVPHKSADGEPTAKQNNLPAPVQQKTAEESQAPKPAKKKKARRET